jgi:hypothetical protein
LGKQGSATHILVGKTVVNRLAVSSCVDHAVVAEARQLLRNGGLSQRKNVLKLRDGTFALGEQAKQQKAILVRESFQEIAGLPRLAHQLIELGRIFRAVAKFSFQVA